jgi:hypothetical protein
MSRRGRGLFCQVILCKAFDKPRLECRLKFAHPWRRRIGDAEKTDSEAHGALGGAVAREQ